MRLRRYFVECAKLGLTQTGFLRNRQEGDFLVEWNCTTMKQERVKIDELVGILKDKLS